MMFLVRLVVTRSCNETTVERSSPENEIFVVFVGNDVSSARANSIGNEHGQEATFSVFVPELETPVIVNNRILQHGGVFRVPCSSTNIFINPLRRSV